MGSAGRAGRTGAPRGPCRRRPRRASPARCTLRRRTIRIESARGVNTAAAAAAAAAAAPGCPRPRPAAASMDARTAAKSAKDAASGGGLAEAARREKFVRRDGRAAERLHVHHADAQQRQGRAQLAAHAAAHAPPRVQHRHPAPEASVSTAAAAASLCRIGAEACQPLVGAGARRNRRRCLPQLPQHPLPAHALEAGQQRPGADEVVDAIDGVSTSAGGPRSGRVVVASRMRGGRRKTRRKTPMPRLPCSVLRRTRRTRRRRRRLPPQGRTRSARSASPTPCWAAVSRCCCCCC